MLPLLLPPRVGASGIVDDGGDGDGDGDDDGIAWSEGGIVASVVVVVDNDDDDDDNDDEATERLWLWYGRPFCVSA